MASRRGYHVQYSTKRTSQVKRRPWTSPGTAGEIFDRLKSSVSSFSVEEAESLNQGSSHSEKETSRDFDEGISSQSSPETKEKVTKDSRLMYSYSHYPRTTPVKAQLKTVGKDSSSPSSGALSTDSNRHPGVLDRSNQEAKKTSKDSLSVFDFDLSGDEDQHEIKLKTPKVSQKGSLGRKPSRKQTLLTQYINNRQDSKQAAGKNGSKVARDGKGANVSVKKSTALSSECDIRNTLSRLLSSKAEGLRAKAAVPNHGENIADLPPLSNVDSTESNLETVTLTESVLRRVKRKVPPTAASVTAKKIPPKKPKIEKNVSSVETNYQIVYSSSSAANKSVVSLDGSQSVKKNGVAGSGTLDRSEIATRTRASTKEKVNDKEEEDHPPRSAPEGSDLLDCLSSEDRVHPGTTPPRGSSTASPERPSPRYTVNSRRWSNVNVPSCVGGGSNDRSTGTAPSSKEVSAGISKSQGAQLAKARSYTSAAKSGADPYSFDDSSQLDRKPLMKKSSSTTTYSLTSHVDLSDRVRSKPHLSLSGRPSQQVASGRGDPALNVPSSQSVPSLKKSSSWPLKPPKVRGQTSGHQRVLSTGKSSIANVSSGSSTSANASNAPLTCSKGEKELYTVVRNVRQAHECLEIGESQQFFDEVNYLLDSIKPSQPLGVRCLGTFNLSTHYFDSEFSRQLRGHSFTPRITALLKDCLNHPTLCLSTAVLFYVMTRDKLNTEWDSNGAAILVGLLSKDESFFSSELGTGKAQREMTKLKNKAKTILKKANTQSSPCPSSSQSLSPDKTDEPSSTSDNVTLSSSDDLMRGMRRDKSDILKEAPHFVNTDNVSVQELACECLISLTQPQHKPQWLRHQLRLIGGLDLLANLVISTVDDVCSVDVSTLPVDSVATSSSPSDYSTGVSNRLATLERRLKALEHATVGNKDNQSYLVVFDGSVLLSKIVRLIAVFQTFIKYNSLRSTSEHCLLTAFKVLLNLTHELQLGCYRLGEQRDIMTVILDVIFKVSNQMTEEDNAFDVTVLGLSLLINLTEMCHSNRTLLESTTVLNDSDSDLVTGESLHTSVSALQVLVQLFVERFSRAESTQIQVPTPQRLSQLTSSSPHGSASQPDKTTQPSTSKRDLLSSFNSRIQQKPTITSSQNVDSQSDATPSSQEDDGLNWLDKELTAKESLPEGEAKEMDSDDEEPLEKVDIDPLVFSREEFDAALHQAGRHMEDSIVAAYTALLLGILAKNNQETLEYIREQMPSKSFVEMTEILKKLVSFMNMTGSTTGLESIRHVIKYLAAL